MSQTIRQSELFAAQDWQVLYKAFTEINFNASDPPSINAALRQYIQANYPEDFTDWIESSEFVALIDLVSWCAGVLAFKTDINARENFLETAEARESILRLARFLSYNAKRCQPARGLLKVRSIQTTDAVIDAFGNNLQNRLITWDDANDLDWLEKMVTVLNSAFVGAHPFGAPLKTADISGVRTHLYRVNSQFGDSDFSFSKTVAGTDMSFEAVNVDIDGTAGFLERPPNFASAYHMVFRADGNGNASADTGFFLPFKQGQLQRQVFQIVNPIENQILDLDVANINQSDVWVQTLDDAGNVTIDWTKVPAVFSDNITFNSVAASTRTIFSVITRDDDKVSIRFADGRFGAAPVGFIRVWYRTSNGLEYIVRPSELAGAAVRLRYTNARGAPQLLTINLDLQEAISNAASRESEEDIRRRAPQIYAAQARMVSGEDYNTYPLQSNLAIKLKALNRIYSGQSRFADLNDPTGTYKDVNVFADDGLFYKERVDAFAEVPVADNRAPAELISDVLLPMIRATETRNYVNDFLVREYRAGNVVVPLGLAWHQTTSETQVSTGWWSTNCQYITPGANFLMSQQGKADEWVTLVAVFDQFLTPPEPGLSGPVTLSAVIGEGAQVTGVIPGYYSSLPAAVQSLISQRIEQNLSFTLWYDYNVFDPAQHWVVGDGVRIDKQPATRGSQVKVANVEFLGGALWRFTSPGFRFVFESQSAVKFYFDGGRTANQVNGRMAEDLVRVLKINEDLNGPFSLQRDYDLTVDHMIRYVDGFQDPRRIAVSFRDSDGDGYPDDPDTYYRVIGADAASSYLFWQRVSDGTFQPISSMIVYQREADRLAAFNVATGTVAFQVESATTPNSFWRKTDAGWVRDFRAFRYGVGRGPNIAATWYLPGTAVAAVLRPDSIKFQWKHYASISHRVDPARSNIIDIFVLPKEYDTLVRKWVTDGAVGPMPAAPTELDLRLAFADYESAKMFSDEVVWRPVRYRLLFGPAADDSLRARFKVVKLPNAQLSDGEIKSRVIAAVNQYFAPELWDFGETFYFTELAAYIHQQLVNNVASVVIVPEASDAVFGDGFEVRCRSDELFISTAQVADVNIIDANTHNNLRIN